MINKTGISLQNPYFNANPRDIKIVSESILQSAEKLAKKRNKSFYKFGAVVSQDTAKLIEEVVSTYEKKIPGLFQLKQQAAHAANRIKKLKETNFIKNNSHRINTTEHSPKAAIPLNNKQSWEFAEDEILTRVIMGHNPDLEYCIASYPKLDFKA